MSIFKITDMQRHQIVSSIQYYIDNLDNPTLKKSYLEKIKDEDFENKMIYSFAEMNFLSQSLIVSIRKSTVKTMKTLTVAISIFKYVLNK